ncbi:RING finger protein 214 [Ascaphus truei]|uniref:RING finger protein 214 n=1 Tax=Ascaphus truei TaxID=8439 RepID=UPI003F5955AD
MTAIRIQNAAVDRPRVDVSPPLQKELVRRREQLKESYQEVLDRQAQAENQLQVQIKQLKQQREDERGEHQETLRSIQEVTVRREEAKKRMEKERKEQSQKEQDVRAEQEKLQSKREGLKQEQTELERKIGTLLAEQAKEKQEWDAELASLTKLDNEVMQSVVRETEREARAEVLSLESRRDLLLVSLEEAENEAEATLSFLKAAPPTLEWLQLKQQWEARMAGVQQLKGNLRDQFDTQIQHVRNGSMLGSLPIISPPKLPSPPSEVSDTHNTNPPSQSHPRPPR